MNQAAELSYSILQPEIGLGIRIFAWLILAIPVLAGFALWQHWHRSRDSKHAVLGMIFAALWTIWSGLQLTGLLPKLHSYQFAALLSVLLFVGTLYDWVKCVWGKRPMLGDLLVMSAIVGAVLC
ncbi:MAG: hypothetical protein KBT70_04565 [Roseovarius sp.]|uniref:hypothetical protein n=1 Tax=Roseovarius sp. TaxID=1486281 RepID=UPI001B5A134D|nr:hypothetical protein [Roseovarius sp.]MBQ0749453.1 hypothetical protein [Roseovarius sp.]